MRVVAGKYGSRPLQAVKGDKTRPTSDKVKGAVFSTLGGFFEGGRMLDCYAGTGSMALEALSRGMDHADLVDESPLAIKTIKENIRSLKAENECSVIKGNIFTVIERLEQPYDLIFIDPPYAKQKNEALIEKLDTFNLIRKGAWVVVESDVKDSFPDEIAGISKVKEKIYRSTKITYYRKGD